MKAYNRMLVLIFLISLAGLLAYLKYEHATELIAAISGPISAYIGVKGKSGTDEARSDEPHGAPATTS